jgi:hypothetical protein
VLFQQLENLNINIFSVKKRFLTILTFVGAPVSGFETVPFGDLTAVEAAFKSQHYAAFLVEVIQGEGGVIVAPPGYLKVRICNEHILTSGRSSIMRFSRRFAHNRRSSDWTRSNRQFPSMRTRVGTSRRFTYA